MPRDTLIQIRRGTAESWRTSNSNLGSVLALGELGYETDTGRLKIGDGSTIWNNLPYSFMRYNDLVAGSGIDLTELANSSGQITGIKIDNAILAGDNITLTLDENNNIVIAGSSPVTLSEGTGIHITQSGDDYNINVSGLTSTLINDFDSAVDARITAASISASEIMDIVGTGVIAGTGIYVDYDTNAFDGQITVSVTGIPSSLITDFASAVSDQVDTTLSAGTGIILDYDSGTDTLTISTSGHFHNWSDITDASLVASLEELAYLSGVVAGTASADRAVVLDSNKDISGIGSITTTGNITVGGNLVINGTTTTVNSTTVDIGDNIIQVNVSGSETLGGLQVLDHDNSKTHQLVWNITDSRWEFINSEGISPDVLTTGDMSANILISTVADGTAPLTVTSTTAVTNLNADLLDGQHGSHYLDWANTTNKPSPVITGILTGNVTGIGSVTLTELGNGVLTIDTVITDNSVALGTDTTGQYATTISVAGTGLSATTPNGDDGTAYTITSNATSANISGTLVARDENGDFGAGLITATGFSGNGSNITNLNASNINAGTIGVTYLPTNIPVTNLTNSGVTIGSTVINLGETKTSFAGLVALSGVSAGSPLVITYAHIDGGSP